jgi:predicted ATP-grasp superfamily ATP-dependent carboligase
MRVLITDGDNRAALAVTRSLGERGHEVVVGERTRHSLAGSSRHAARSFVYPDPGREETAFLDTVHDATERHRINVLLPVSDITTMLIAAHRSLWEPSCAVPFAPEGSLLRAADKLDTLRTAERLGVPVPRSWVIASAFDHPPSGLEYPIVLKPYRSRVRTNVGWQSCSVRYALSEASLRLELSRRPPHEFPIILQERVTGPGIGVFMCFDRGRPIAAFSHRRLREKPPSGGVSVLCESIAMDPMLQAHAERLLSELAWHGVGMVEFKVDPRDGQAKLMEINGRFWGSLQLAIDAGVDFPALLVDLAVGRAPASTSVYRAGVRNRWLWGDIDSLILRLRARSTARFLSDGKGRLTALREFLPLWGRDLHYDNPRWSDLRPWFHETRRRLRGAA